MNRTIRQIRARILSQNLFISIFHLLHNQIMNIRQRNLQNSEIKILIMQVKVRESSNVHYRLLPQDGGRGTFEIGHNRVVIHTRIITESSDRLTFQSRDWATVSETRSNLYKASDWISLHWPAQHTLPHISSILFLAKLYYAKVQ